MTERGLLLPTKSELASCEREMTVSASDLPPTSFPGWESVAKQYAEILLTELAVERQTINDCQGNALATEEEARKRLTTGVMQQLARTYAYNASEWISGGASRIGRDQGTTIQSGVTLMTKGIRDLGIAPGLPTESDWPYGSYERNGQRFAERAKGAVIVPSSVVNHGPAPTAEQLPLVCAVGGSVHGGVFWAPRFTTRIINGRRWKVWASTPTRGGGHALAFGICVLWIEEEGCFWPVIWNSHGDGPILMPPEHWDTYARNQFAPYGGYVMLPDKPEEKWYDRVASGGGYI
jgi:hypothetical protein